MNQIIFPEKVAGEKESYTVNFSDRLQFGEGINGASVTVSVYSGTDPNPGAMVSGSATFDANGNVTQVLLGGLPGVIYNIVYLVTGTNAHNYIKVGQLAVSSDNPFADVG